MILLNFNLDAFKAEVERDSKERSKRRKENLDASISHKEKGNNCFKAGNYAEAVEWYTKAIVLSPDQIKYYSNRAQVRVFFFYGGGGFIFLFLISATVVFSQVGRRICLLFIK